MQVNTILLVEDDFAQAGRTRAEIESRGLSVAVARSGEEALAIAQQLHPVAIISDVLMPSMDGFQLCREVREIPALSQTPFILTTSGRVDDGTREFAFDVGADSFVDRGAMLDVLGGVLASRGQTFGRGGMPYDHLDEEAYQVRHGASLLSTSIREAEALMREKENLADAYRGTLGALTEALNLRDDGASLRARRVTGYGLALATKLGLSPTDPSVANMVWSALLCDVGNLGVSEQILTKAGELTDDERVELQAHPMHTANMLGDIGPLHEVAETVLAHHERWDGGGYPRGIRGDQIPWPARVIAVADAVESITSERPYRAAATFETATEELARCSGTQFDPEVVSAAIGIAPAEWSPIKESAELAHPARQTSIAGYL